MFVKSLAHVLGLMKWLSTKAENVYTDLVSVPCVGHFIHSSALVFSPSLNGAYVIVCQSVSLTGARLDDKKHHRNGIHRPKSHRYPSMRGVGQCLLSFLQRRLLISREPYSFNVLFPLQVDPKFLKNLKFSRKHNKKSVAAGKN
ncbi:large subunit ribosomal protein L29e [Biomphalaria glabrata]|nr:large subunit ribosomal protein L29e [Biomphalaria glabrata]